MLLVKRCTNKTLSARMAHVCPELHIPGQICGCYFALYGTHWIVWCTIPFCASFRVFINMAADHAAIVCILSLGCIYMIGFYFFPGYLIEFSLHVNQHQLLHS